MKVRKEIVFRGVREIGAGVEGGVLAVEELRGLGGKVSMFVV